MYFWNITQQFYHTCVRLCHLCHVIYNMFIFKLCGYALISASSHGFGLNIWVLDPGLNRECLVVTLASVLLTTLVCRFGVLDMQLMQVWVLRQCALNCRHGTYNTELADKTDLLQKNIQQMCDCDSSEYSRWHSSLDCHTILCYVHGPTVEFLSQYFTEAQVFNWSLLEHSRDKNNTLLSVQCQYSRLKVSPIQCQWHAIYNTINIGVIFATVVTTTITTTNSLVQWFCLTGLFSTRLFSTLTTSYIKRSPYKNLGDSWRPKVLLTAYQQSLITQQSDYWN